MTKLRPGAVGLYVRDILEPGMYPVGVLFPSNFSDVITNKKLDELQNRYNGRLLICHHTASGHMYVRLEVQACSMRATRSAIQSLKQIVQKTLGAGVMVQGYSTSAEVEKLLAA